MQAVILSGGEGTRLRPLTSTVPKPMVPLVNRPIVRYMIDWLADNGVTDIVMACGFLADGLRAHLGDGGGEGLSIRYVEEPQALGTAGAVKFAEEVLDDRFLVLNGDVLLEFDLRALIDLHLEREARATIALVEVDDPTAYGLVFADPDGAVTEFVEKPSADRVPDRALISAGAYVIKRDVLELVPAHEQWSFERGVFPKLIGDGLFAYETHGYWLDVGTPARYLQATCDVLERRIKSHVYDKMSEGYLSVAPDLVSEGARIVPPAVIDDACVLAPGVQVGGLAVLGHGCVLGADTLVEHSVVHHGCTLGDHVVLRNAILAAGVEIGDHTRVDGGSVIGEGARIGAHNVISNGSRISAGVDIPDGAMRF